MGGGMPFAQLNTGMVHRAVTGKWLGANHSDRMWANKDRLIEQIERMDGVNLPPMHPTCRSTTIPYFEPDEFDEVSERIARDPVTGKNYMVPGGYDV